MRVVILTSLERSTASLAIPRLLLSTHDLAGVIFADSGAPAGWRKRLSKIRRIGLLGALNGIRMRPWFDDEPAAQLAIRSISDLCHEAHVPLIRVPSIGSTETEAALRHFDADLGLSLGNGYIPERIFSIPKDGMLNIHHELLPEFRGAQSILWQIYCGSDRTGYTVHRINKAIDGGDILFRAEVPIPYCASLHETVVEGRMQLLLSSMDGLIQVLDDFARLARQSVPQGAGRSYTTPSFGQFLTMLYRHRQLRGAGKSKV
ncbi:MAG: hypothetical protein GC166_14285 [Alphaproteobacteria bacterium]|nr:hypothetical protein [Alphaproteobacteria bacterium]